MQLQIYHPSVTPRILLMACLGICLNVSATHLVGGDFDYIHLGGNDYQITLKIYRDCSPANIEGTGFDGTVAIGMWNGDGSIETEDVLYIPLTANNVTNVPIVMGNPCGTAPPDLCIEQAIYSTVVTLPATSYGWDLVYQRCCRNPTIVNLDDFGTGTQSGMTLQIHIPGLDATAESNSSPAFQELPPVALCADLPFEWDHSAVDPDGDELVYSLCAPFQGADALNPQPSPPSTPPYLDVPYIAGFSAENPMTADPSMAIDSATGLLTCTPTAVGQFAIGICVQEFRNGTLLSTVTRDFQFNVTICEPAELELEADAVPFAAAGIDALVPYADAIGMLPEILTYPNGENFPMAAWLNDNEAPIMVDGQMMVVDAVVIEGCNDARFTIYRPAAESNNLDTNFLSLSGTATQGLDFDEYFYQVIMPPGVDSAVIELGLIADDDLEGVEHLTIVCTYVNVCNEVSTTSANVVIVDPIPIQVKQNELDCITSDGLRTVGYEEIIGYGPFQYVWDDRVWNNASQPSSEWTNAFDSLVTVLDDEGELMPYRSVKLQITDQCGKALIDEIALIQPVARAAELCPGERIEFPAYNGSIPVANVLFNGESIVNSLPLGSPFLAHAIAEEPGWKLTSLEALGNNGVVEGTLSLIDTCGFTTTSVLEIPNCLIPNVFSPDQYAGNLTFRIRGLSNLPGTQLLIWNRYGTLIWENRTETEDDTELVWAGDYANGDPAPEGVYQWMLLRPDGEQQQGILHLYRQQ